MQAFDQDEASASDLEICLENKPENQSQLKLSKELIRRACQENPVSKVLLDKEIIRLVKLCRKSQKHSLDRDRPSEVYLGRPSVIIDDQELLQAIQYLP